MTTPANKIGGANRRPATPLIAWSQIGRAIHALKGPVHEIVTFFTRSLKQGVRP